MKTMLSGISSTEDLAQLELNILKLEMTSAHSERIGKIQRQHKDREHVLFNQVLESEAELRRVIQTRFEQEQVSKKESAALREQLFEIQQRYSGIERFLHFFGQELVGVRELFLKRMIENLHNILLLVNAQNSAVGSGTSSLSTPFNKDDKATSLGELLSLNDGEFVKCAYHTLLNRMPDDDGLSFHVMRLHDGLRKVRVLADLRLSGEGQKKAAVIIGLGEAIERFTQDTTYISLEELLSWNDENFIRCAAGAILGHEPDDVTLEHYAAKLKHGATKLQLLAEFRESSAGKLHNVQIEGLDVVVRRYGKLRFLYMPFVLLSRFGSLFHRFRGTTPVPVNRSYDVQAIRSQIEHLEDIGSLCRDQLTQIVNHIDAELAQPRPHVLLSAVEVVAVDRSREQVERLSVRERKVYGQIKLTADRVRRVSPCV